MQHIELGKSNRGKILSLFKIEKNEKIFDLFKGFMVKLTIKLENVVVTHFFNLWLKRTLKSKFWYFLKVGKGGTPRSTNVGRQTKSCTMMQKIDCVGQKL